MIMLPGNRIKIPGETRARHCQISGRWRDRSLERPLAGATALFYSLCAADRTAGVGACWSGDSGGLSISPRL